MALLLEYGSSAEAPDGTREASWEELRTLLSAAASGSLAKARAALQPHFSHANLMAALVHAVAAGSTNVASYLLARTRTLPLPTPGHSGSVPCPDAALAAVVRRFVAGPDLEAAGGWGSWGAEELQRALEDGLYRTAAALLEGGAHPSAAGQPSAFHAALRLSFPPEALPFLIHPGMVAATDTEGRTPLHALVAANHWGASVRAPLAAQLAAAGAPLAARDADGLTPLAAVCQRRREQQGQGGLPLILALSTADSVSAPSGDGRTPLQCTVAAGDVGAAAAMAAAGALDTATAQSMLALATSRASVAPEHVAALRVAGAELQGGTAIASRSAAVWHAFTAPLEVALARYGGTFKRSALLAALGRLSLPALAGELRQLATAATDAAGTARQHLQTVEAGYEAADDRYHAVYDNEVQLWMMRLNPPPIRLILKAANPEPGDRRPEGQRLADAVYFEARNQATVSPAVGTAVEARRHALQAVGQARSLVASAGRAAEAARARRAAPELRAFLLCMHRLDKKQHKQLPALPAVAIESICLLVLLQGNV